MADSSSGWVRDGARHAVALLTGVLALALTAWGIGAMLPFPDVPAIAPKYRYFAEHRNEYEMLFLGSSRFYHQIIPHEFDAAVKGLAGTSLRSFNAAYDAVWPPESYYYLRRLLALRPRRLKWVVIDAMDINPKLDPLGEVTRRQAYWHDWQHTKMALAATEESERTPEQKRKLLWEHLVLWMRESVHVGRGAEALAARLEPVKDRARRPPEWEGEDGYHAGGAAGLTGEAQTRFLTEVNRLRQELQPAQPAPALAKAMGEMVAEVRAAGAEPIFVTAPTLNEKENLATVPGGASLIAFSDPRQYPRLYEPELHYDGWHLNEKGAHEFTQLLAERMAPLLKPKP